VLLISYALEYVFNHGSKGLLTPFAIVSLVILLEMSCAMNPVLKTTGMDTKLSGWDDAKSATANWSIERSANVLEGVPFFPDQNGKVYELLLHKLPIVLHSMDGSGRLTTVNNEWCKTFGYGALEAIGRPFNEFLAPQSRTHLVTQIYPRYLVTGMCHNEELFVQRKDGSLATVLLTMTAYRGEKGRIERSVCMLQDITAQKIAEIASTRSDQRFKGAFAAAVHGMAVVSPTGMIELANTALCEFLGRPDLESSTAAFDEMLHNDDRSQFINGMRQLLTGEVPVLQQELRYLAADKKIMHGATSISLVKNETGDTEQLIVQVIDVTDRNVVNQRLQKAQKMEAIGQLTGGLAHDFNNLLTIIIGNLQLVEGKVQTDEKSAARMAEAINAAQKGSDLTRQLLAFARKQELEPQDVLVNDLVSGMESLVARTIGENMELRVQIMPGTPHALIDPSQLESAILNLSINARDAMPEGGRVTIETQPAYLDSFYAEKHPEVTPGHYVLVAVSDNGCGMSAELLEKVFQPFFTTKAPGKGTGLGLSMVYGFIKQSGGHISVYSEVGHGTSIKMYLPRRMMPGEVLPGGEILEIAAVVPQADEPVAAAVRKPKILVVEDQEAVRAVACGFLEDFGYDIIEAGDGFEALARLQENPDVDLMFSDVVMPGGMNGFDLAQAATGMKPDLKVVHTSGYPKGAMVHQDEPRFKNGFIIMKPYRREELQKIIRDALEIQ
jgi:PAS domain S-box-containing protein